MSRKTTGILKLRRFACMLFAWMVSTVAYGHVVGDQSRSICISEIRSSDSLSVVEIDGGYDAALGNGMKLLALDEASTPLAELIIIDASQTKAYAMITEFYEPTDLKAGQRVEIKTLNFAAQWK